MNSANANIELNEIMNSDNKIPYKKGANTTEEANLALQEDFNSTNNPEEVAPTYISNGTQATKITGENN
ncbi:hypothetical protein [Lederbergia graminis]